MTPALLALCNGTWRVNGISRKAGVYHVWCEREPLGPVDAEVRDKKTIHTSNRDLWTAIERAAELARGCGEGVEDE